MPRTISTVGLIVLLVTAVAATGFANIKSPPAFAHEDHAKFITNAEFIRGHLQQAVANKQTGNNSLAIAHASHPVAEVFTLMKGPLEKASPLRAADLEGALQALQISIQADTIQAVEQKVNDINGMLDEAIEVYAGEEANELSTKVGVAKGLLETAGAEYSEAVRDGKIIEMIEYQDASAFIDRANVTFATMQTQIDEHRAEEITDLFQQLGKSVAAKSNPAQVQMNLDGIVQEFDEIIPQDENGTRYDGQAYIDKIFELLDDSVSSYKAGNTQQAKSFAVEAYLENYEFIEDDINEDDQVLMKKIEVEMRDEYVNMINDGRPASEIEDHVDLIKADLEEARAVVVPEFPTAIIAVAATMAMAVAILRFNGIAGINKSVR